MSIFSFKLKDFFKLKDLKNKEYELICLEYGKLVNIYSINIELNSKNVWNYITNNFDIWYEKNIITHTTIKIDKKNKQYKLYKYIIKYDLNEKVFIYLVFKENKNSIFSFDIYYDSQMISTKELENTIIKDIRMLKN